jgi:hypothetical protein
MALQSNINSVRSYNALQPVSRKGELVLDVPSPAGLLTVFTVFNCTPLQAECVALFSASSCENCLKHVDGFTGAVFFASSCGRFELEFMLWSDHAALAAVKASPSLCEPMKVIEHHCCIRYRSFGAVSNAAAGDTKRFARGERYYLRVYSRPASEMPTKSDGRPSGSAREKSLVQRTEDSTSLVLLPLDAIDTFGARALHTTSGELAFQSEFTVVEHVEAPSAHEKFPTPYNLALITP